MGSGFPYVSRGNAANKGPTALACGLRIDADVDERRDPIRVTEAALAYLQTLYEQFRSWYLAAAASNAGPTRVPPGGSPAEVASLGSRRRRVTANN